MQDYIVMHGYAKRPVLHGEHLTKPLIIRKEQIRTSKSNMLFQMEVYNRTPT